MSPEERYRTYTRRDWFLGAMVLLLIAGTVTTYYLTAEGNPDLAPIWTKALFVPILLAGWRFGLIGGAASALIGSVALAPQFIYMGELDTAGWVDLSELLMLNLVGWSFGLMAEYHHRRSSEVGRLARDLGLANAELAELVGLRDRVARIEKLESVNRLAGGVAHELRNPLASIKTTVQVTPKEGLSREVMEAFSVIEQEVGRADAVVKKLLGRSIRSPETVSLSLRELISEAVELIQPRLKGLILTVNLTTEELNVGCDADALVSALVNLLANASEAATSALNITLTTQGNMAVIRVSDDGPGIAAQDTKRLFEPFFTTKPGGTGLGLFLARQAIGTCNGSLSYDSEVKTGSVFEIRLPLSREP